MATKRPTTRTLIEDLQFSAWEEDFQQFSTLTLTELHLAAEAAAPVLRCPVCLCPKSVKSGECYCGHVFLK